MPNTTIQGVKGSPAKPDSMSAKTKAAIDAGLPKRTAMSTTISGGKNAKTSVK